MLQKEHDEDMKEPQEAQPEGGGYAQGYYPTQLQVYCARQKNELI